ncbi:MAG: tetratricopeptide repeat protein [Candidatus Omnitrophota bacterium]|nr:tetratricopeptide repeat protein [Candidatus Omnitrophota bacterium]
MEIKKHKILKIMVMIVSVIVIIAGGITVKTYVNEKRTQQTYIVTGLPEKQTGVLKELQIVATEHAYITQGYEYLKTGDFNKAREQFEIVLKRNQPTGALPEARRGIVDVYEKIHDYVTAAKSFEKIIATFKIPKGDMWRLPDDERLSYLLYAANGDYDLAIEHAQKALEADSQLPNAPKGGSPDYIQRLNDLKAAKDYILSLKKQ